MAGSALGGSMATAAGGMRPQGGQLVGNQIVPNGYEVGASGRVEPMANMPPKVDSGLFGGLGGKGGIGGSKVPAGTQPTQGQYAPLSAQGNFNVNQAAAGSLQQAIQGTQAGMSFQPQQIGAATYAPSTVSSQGYGASSIAGASPISAQSVQAGQIAGANLGAYTNPYESQVVGQALGDIERSRLMQQNQLGAQASAARAFGGSRQGIAEAETNRAFAEQAAQTASGLRQAGFQNAQQLAGQDIASRMQAAQANQGANLTAQGQTAANVLAAQQANQAALNQASQFGAGAANTAALQNQGAYNQAGQFNAGAMNAAAMQSQQAQIQANQQRLGAASQLGQLGNQAFNTGQTIQQNQMQQGLMQQGLQQALIDAARGQYAGYTGAPAASLNAPLAALGVAGQNPGSTTTGTRTNGIWDIIGGGLSTYAALPSDPRLKTNITPRGEVGGVNFYDWEWNDEGKRIADPDQPTFGVMADELQKTHPHLVKRGEDGYLRVNYNGLAAELEAA